LDRRHHRVTQWRLQIVFDFRRAVVCVAGDLQFGMTPHHATSKKPLCLSVLDQSPIPEGSDGGVALRNSVDLAQHAESLGYHRYWVAEHHATPALACASPEVLIGPIAAATQRIRIGSGGVMLPHYSPLKVAENFCMLSAMFDDRIDLGIGRAPGTDQATAVALQRDRRSRLPDDFPEQLEELLGYFGDDRAPKTRLSQRRVIPGLPHTPTPYLLGSSPMSGHWAAQYGLPYVFADFISPTGVEIAARYRELFQPSQHLAEPKVIVAAWAICAESDEAARRLASSFQMLMTLLHRGQLIAVPPVEKAVEFLESEGQTPGVLPPGRRAIVGSPATVKEGLETLAQAYGAHEVMVVNIMHNHEARKRSYTLVSQAFQDAAGTH
jgi:luciferase family oxidoreductase group 1